jgi:dihydrodipicolinate synthase/N-acetylneuraminate lyase
LNINRLDWPELIFPTQGLPRLWCPPITHYRKDGVIDLVRMEAHLRFMSRWVKGYLLFGTTGDGWELTQEEKKMALGFFLSKAKALGIGLLIGCLKSEAWAARDDIYETLRWVRERTGASSDTDALVRANICGFAVCPPTGQGFSQPEIQAGLSTVLETGLPIALYQIPQVTKNEISPEVLSALASRFANFYLFKDTSGNDTAVLSGLLPGKVFCVRGMEGDYSRWLDPGRLYDGFLLSMANGMARELDEMIAAFLSGKGARAEALSDRVSSVIRGLHHAVSDIAEGNRFTNSVKAMDHFLAWGEKALDTDPPRLHGGTSLSREIIRRTRDVLLAHRIEIGKGYLSK